MYGQRGLEARPADPDGSACVLCATQLAAAATVTRGADSD